LKRRDFIMLLGSAAGAWPLAARAQQPSMPVIGFVRSASNANAPNLVDAFRQGLKDGGFTDGQNVAIVIRSAEDREDQLLALVQDLIHRQVAVFVGNTPAALAAKAASKVVPIVFATGLDPVKVGLVTNLNRPGGNVTGVAFFGGVLEAKRLELLRQVVPGATVIGLLVNPDNLSSGAAQSEIKGAAQSMGLEVATVEVRDANQLDPAFATMIQHGAGAFLTAGDAFFFSHRAQIIALANRHALPAIFDVREFVKDGGLMSYAPSINEAFRQTGVYAGQILKGEKPGDLPVMQSTKFEFVLNLKTAKTLGLTVPPTLLAIADEVIE
jgi:putative ABC transport system substrate-binding protein